MVAYSFQGWLVPKILAGTKDQTIRADRKRHARPEELVQLFTGLRTKQCRWIGVARCILVARIELNLNRGSGHVRYANIQLSTAPKLDAFAARDGFNDWPHMAAFFIATHGLVSDRFCGVLIRWRGLVQPGAGAVPK